MQGTDDDVIDIVHGKTLHKLAKNAHPPLWAEGFTHQASSGQRLNVLCMVHAERIVAVCFWQDIYRQRTETIRIFWRQE